MRHSEIINSHSYCCNHHDQTICCPCVCPWVVHSRVPPSTMRVNNDRCPTGREGPVIFDCRCNLCLLFLNLSKHTLFAYFAPSQAKASQALLKSYLNHNRYYDISADPVAVLPEFTSGQAAKDINNLIFYNGYRMS